MWSYVSRRRSEEAGGGGIPQEVLEISSIKSSSDGFLSS